MKVRGQSLTMKAALVLLCGCLQMMMIAVNINNTSRQMIRIIHHVFAWTDSNPFVRITLRAVINTTATHKILARC